MACDICGKTGTPLTELREFYQTADIKSVCNGCEREVNAQLFKVRTLTNRIMHKLLQRFMRNRRRKAAAWRVDPAAGLHAHLLTLLGATDHTDAARIIAGFHAAQLSAEHRADERHAITPTDQHN